MRDTASESVWTRPLGRRFFVWVALTCLAIVVGIEVFAYVASTVRWVKSRSIAYRGSFIPLPFRWGYDKDGLLLTIAKRSWYLGLLGVESSLHIDHLILSPVEGEKRMDKFIELQDKLPFQYRIGSSLDAFTDAKGHPLPCVENKFPSFVQMICLSNDATWSFYYEGSSRDAREVNSSLQYLLDHQKDFK